MGLGGLVVGVGVADGDAAGEKDEPAEVVESFAAVELAADLFLALILSTVALSRRRVRTSRIPGGESSGHANCRSKGWLDLCSEPIMATEHGNGRHTRLCNKQRVWQLRTAGCPASSRA